MKASMWRKNLTLVSVHHIIVSSLFFSLINCFLPEWLLFLWFLCVGYKMQRLTAWSPVWLKIFIIHTTCVFFYTILYRFRTSIDSINATKKNKERNISVNILVITIIDWSCLTWVGHSALMFASITIQVSDSHKLTVSFVTWMLMITAGYSTLDHRAARTSIKLHLSKGNSQFVLQPPFKHGNERPIAHVSRSEVSVW